MKKRLQRICKKRQAYVNLNLNSKPMMTQGETHKHNYSNHCCEVGSTDSCESAWNLELGRMKVSINFNTSKIPQPITQESKLDDLLLLQNQVWTPHGFFPVLSSSIFSAFTVNMSMLFRCFGTIIILCQKTWQQLVQHSTTSTWLEQQNYRKHKNSTEIKNKPCEIHTINPYQSFNLYLHFPSIRNHL